MLDLSTYNPASHSLLPTGTLFALTTVDKTANAEINLRTAILKAKIERVQALLNREEPNLNKALKILQPLSRQKMAPWPVFHFMGIVHIHKGDFKTALKWLQKAVRLGADAPETLHSISICHFKLASFEEALEFEQQALEKNEDSFKGWLHLGSIYRAQAKLDKALECYKRANQIQPNDIHVAYRIGRIYQDQGNLNKALELYNFTLKKNPNYNDIKAAKAEVLKDQGRFDEAETCLNAILEQEPNHLRAQLLLGEVYRIQGKYEKAIQLLEQLLKDTPNAAELQVNLAVCKQEIGQYDESEQHFLQALENKPGENLSFSGYLMALHYNPKQSKEKIFEAHKLWDHHFTPKERPKRPIPSTNINQDKKLRIGFLSGGFRRHPVGWMITQGLEYLPREQFEIYCYNTAKTLDPLTKRIAGVTDEWKSVVGYNEEVIARMIREDEIDILVELSGHAADNRLRTVALEPAPIIVKWVGGLFNTTGLQAVDFLITDWSETPEGEERFYTEKLVRMPDDYICFLPPDYAPDVESLPAQKNGYITLGCFNNPAKVNNSILEKWAEVMKQIPNSRLFLKSKQYDTEVFRERIIKKMKEYGIPKDRLIFEGRSEHRVLLDSYNKIDIALDPWPYSGGLTTCEALWMGVPVITKPGPTFAGRHSATHLNNAGFPEWVAETWEEYVDTAVALANDTEKLAEIRASLRDTVARSPLCDGQRFAAHLAMAFREMWEQRVEGYEKNLPEGEWQEHIEVKALTEQEIEELVGKPVPAMAERADDASRGSGMLTDETSESKPAPDVTDEEEYCKESKTDSMVTGIHTNGVSTTEDSGTHQAGTYKTETKDGVTVCTPADLNLLTPYVLLEQEQWYEPELNFVREYLKPGMSALDIGAGFGVYALPMAKLAGEEGTVYAFEPGTTARRHLEMSKLENRLDNLEVIARAVADQSGKASFHLADTPELNRLDEEGNEEVSQTTLDAWWEFEGRPEIDFIKLDVNGSEVDVLAGSESLLKETAPVMLIAAGEDEQRHTAAIKQLLKKGYRLYEYVPGPRLLAPHDENGQRDSYLMNLIAIKGESEKAFKTSGWIYTEPAEPKTPEAGLWKQVLSGLPWAQAAMDQWKQVPHSGWRGEYLHALNCLCAAEHIDVSSTKNLIRRSEKAALMLQAAGSLIGLYNGGHTGLPVALTLARVLNALGKREQAVEIMKNGMESSELSGQTMRASLPFLLPLPEQDEAPIHTDFVKWLTVRVTEAWVLLRDRTSYNCGEKTKILLGTLKGNPEILTDMERRAIVFSLRHDSGLSSEQRQHALKALRADGKLRYGSENTTIRENLAIRKNELISQSGQTLAHELNNTNQQEQVIHHRFWNAPISPQKAQVAHSIAKKLQLNEAAEIRQQVIEECQKRIDQDSTDSMAFFILVNALLATELTDTATVDKHLLNKLRDKQWEHKEALYAYFYDRIEMFNDVSSPECSVVVVSNKINEEVLENLREIGRQKDDNTEVIFVNNGLEEKIAGRVNEYVDTLIHLKQNAGACMARNFGALFSEGNILLFIDDDGVPEEGMLAAHRRRHKEMDIIGARGACKPKSGGEIPWHYNLGPKTKPAACYLEGNTSFKAKPFFTVNGWNDRILIGHEGIELSYRLYKNGYDKEKLVYIPDAILNHDFIKPVKRQARKNKLSQSSILLIRSSYADFDNVISSWPTTFKNTQLPNRVGNSSNNSAYNNLSKVIYLAPGNIDKATGNHHNGQHNRRANMLHNLTLKEGLDSEVLYLTDPRFLQKIVEISKTPGHAIDSGVMGYPSWVTIDRVQSANLFDVLGANMFALIGDHLFANFMWQRLEKMGSNTTFYTQAPSMLDELSVFGKNNPSFLIEHMPVLTNAVNSQGIKKMDSRDIDILIPWSINLNLSDYNTIQRALNNLGETVALVGAELIKKLKSNYKQSVLSVFNECYASETGDLYKFQERKTKDDYRWMNMLHIVDQHVRQWRRFNMLRSLNQVPEKFNIVITAEKNQVSKLPELYSKSNVKWTGKVTTEQLDNLYLNSKLVLNCNPTYPDFIHERVRNAMSWGCCVISDRNTALEGKFINNEHIIFADALPQWQDILKYKNIELQQIADKGNTLIKAQYTQEKFCRVLLKEIDKRIQA